MNDKQIREKAKELIECMGMWNIRLGDCRKICDEMLRQSILLKEMPNPLAGTGLKALTGNDEDKADLIRQRIFHEPKGSA